MRIFMLIKWLHHSGAPKMFAWVANSLANQGHDVAVFTYHDYQGECVALSDKVRHIHKSLDSVGIVGKVLAIRQAIKEVAPDVSISFLLDANIYNIFACLGQRTKSVVCERSDPYKPRYYKLKFWKPWFRLAKGAVFQLPQVAKYYSNIKSKTAIIPNPIIDHDNIVCLPVERRKPRIVTHGRIDLEQKRHDILIEAFALLHKDFPEYSLSIYGKDDDKEERNLKTLKSLVMKLGVGQHVRFEGETLSPKESIQDARVWVLTSDYEGIPNSLVEAMSMGLACVATDCSPGGARFLIQDGVNGCLVGRGDVQNLYLKMRYLIELPDESNRMGEEAKKIKRTYNESAILRLWEDYLQVIIND